MSEHLARHVDDENPRHTSTLKKVVSVIEKELVFWDGDGDLDSVVEKVGLPDIEMLPSVFETLSESELVDELVWAETVTDEVSVTSGCSQVG